MQYPPLNIFRWHDISPFSPFSIFIFLIQLIEMHFPFRSFQVSVWNLIFMHISLYMYTPYSGSIRKDNGKVYVILTRVFVFEAKKENGLKFMYLLGLSWKNQPPLLFFSYFIFFFFLK